MYNPTTPKNLLGFSEDFSNAAWGKSNIKAFGSGSISNAILAPNELQTADFLVPETSNSTHRVQCIVSLPTSTPVKYSLYAKAGGYDKIGIWDYATTGAYASFQLAGAGNVLDFGIGASNPTIIALSNGWYRISFSSTGSASTGFAVQILSPSYTTSSVSVSWAADGISGIYLWGAQLSDSASLDTYVPNYGAAPTAAAYYGPRLDYDPVTLAAKGLLVEEQRVNRIRYSRTLQTTSSYWGNLASGTANTITIDNATGPDGLSTSASLITFNTAVTGAGTYSVWRHTLSTTANGTYTFSVWLKAGTTSSVYLRFSDGGGNRANTLCTLTSSWQRFTVTGATVASITTIGCDIGADGNAGGQTLTAGTVYAYGAQLELGDFATSYIPNGDAIAGATRNADVASVSTQAFPYSASESTIVASASPIGPGGAAAGSAVFSLKGASGNGLLLYQPATTYSLVAYVDASNVALGTSSLGAIEKLAIAYNGVSNGAVRNGGAVSSVGTTVAAVASSFDFGNIQASYVFNGHIRQITYLPRRISNTELQTRTV
jgi:hypothetical protein